MGFWARYRKGIRVAVPFAVAVGAFGISFGVLAREAGIGSFASVVMSATTFAGSAQFAVASVLGTGGGVAAACIAALLLNARYGPIGMSVAPALEGGRLKRLIEAQIVVDESWALSNKGGGRFDRQILIGAGTLLYVSWVVADQVAGENAERRADHPGHVQQGAGADQDLPVEAAATLVGQDRKSVV